MDIVSFGLVPRPRVPASPRPPMLSAAESGEDVDLGALAHRRAKSPRIPDALPVDENVDVRPQLSALRDHAVANRRTMGPQQRQRFRYRLGRAVNANLAAVDS